MSSSSTTQSALDDSHALLKSLGGDASLLPEPYRTVVMADTAFGLLGNGGTEYFFESDFPGKPDYFHFVRAFRNLGYVEIADAQTKLAELFPFADPHLHQDRRTAFLKAPSETFRLALSTFDRAVFDISDLDEQLLNFYTDMRATI